MFELDRVFPFVIEPVWVFRVFGLRDMKIATREDCRMGQNLSYRFGFG